VSRTIKIHVSAGELVDKITILEIKNKKITDNNKLKLIAYELKLLSGELNKLNHNSPVSTSEFAKLKDSLCRINLRLWKIEDSIRALEANKDFGEKFIELARNVYITNDKRSEIKNKINNLFHSQIQEVKYYTPYKK